MDKYVTIIDDKNNKKMFDKIDKISEKMIKKFKYYNVFTDGSCDNNNRNAINSHAGIGVFWDDNDPLNLSETFDISPITNNRAEIYAIIRAVQLFELFELNKKYINVLNIYTDSKLTVNIMNLWIEKWIQNNWRKNDNKIPLNLDLIKKLYKLIKKNKNNFKIKLIHVRAHKKKPKDIYSQKYYLWHGNNEADKLAKESAFNF